MKRFPHLPAPAVLLARLRMKCFPHCQDVAFLLASLVWLTALFSGCSPAPALPGATPAPPPAAVSGAVVDLDGVRYELVRAEEIFPGGLVEHAQWRRADRPQSIYIEAIDSRPDRRKFTPIGR